MSAERRYREYEWVVLASPIKCPMRGVSADNFPGDRFSFFVENGMFCIEVRGKPDVVTEVAPAQIKEARRKIVAKEP